MRSALFAVVAGLALVPAAVAGTPSAPVYDGKGRLVETPFAPTPPAPLLTEQRATSAFLRHPKVADWLRRYPKAVRREAEYKEDFRYWKVDVWSGDAGQIATGRVDDATGVVTEAWTGPQVAWKMARGGPGAFGGEKINDPVIWLALCAVFLLGLADLRRPLSLRNLDLLVLLSFSVSLWFFNRGDIFTSVPVAYPPLLYLLARTAWIGVRDRVGGRVRRPVWPVWVLVGATVFLAGFRVGLNVQTSNVIDVGYAGVIGAHRLVDGEAPYGHFPRGDDELRPCGTEDSDGEIRDRVQTNGRCEHANEFGDTYGPFSYAVYVPGYLVFGWNGRWDDLPAAHATSILFDLICIAGLALVGLRFGGPRLGATLAFAWAAYPFTLYVSSSNTNDAIFPAFLILGFLVAASAWKRGALCAVAGWTKFASLIVAPLWLTYPALKAPVREADRGRGSGGTGRFTQWEPVRFAAGFAGASLVALSVLLLEPNPLRAAWTLIDRTVVTQVTRESPFSLWDWGQYRAAGIPDLHLVQLALEGLVVAGALAVAVVPRRKSPLQLAAFTAALLVAFEIVLTHWFYLYIPWFFPFVAFAVLAPAVRAPAVEEAPEPSGRELRELVAAN